MEISPYAVFRRSRLPLVELEGVSFDSTWGLIEERRRLRAELNRRSGNLSDYLGTLIGELGGESRMALVTLRRDLHNRRAGRVQEQLVKISDRLPDSGVSEIRAWVALSAKLLDLGKEISGSWEQDRSRSAAHLRNLFQHDAIERSIQLSGQQLYEDLQDFALHDKAPLKPAKARARESSLVNYLYRAAFKPSPFGRFTEIGAFDPERAGTPSGSVAEQISSITTLNRLLVNWVLTALPLVGDGLEIGDLVLSSTARERGDTIEYIGVLPGNWQKGELAIERLVRVRPDGLLLSVVRQLSAGSMKGALVLEELTRLGADAASARTLLRGLLRLGIVFYRPPADDHDRAYADRILTMLGDGRSHAVAALREQFVVLLELEHRFADEPATGRALLMESAQEAVTGIARSAGVAPPPEGILKSPVFEDTPAIEPPHAWNRGVVERAKPALKSLWRLGTALDSGQERRLGLYSYATSVFSRSDTISFLDFFDHFSRLSSSDQSDVLSGRHSDEAGQFRRDRAEAVRRIRKAADGSVSDMRIEPEEINRAVDGIRGLRETESVTFRAQFASLGVNGHTALVVNGILTGYGVYMSRFGAFVPQTEGWSLPMAQREHLARRFPSQVDLNAVLGFNFNLHPPVCAAVVDYPGARTMSSSRVYRPAELDVQIDHGARMLKLWGPMGEAVDLVPMNFMTPYGVPLLYRLLEQMSPSNRYLWNPWEDILGEPTPLGPAPRLLVGDVVADRRAWAFAANDIPDLTALSRDDRDALEGIDLWRTAMGLPREGFVLCQTAAERAVLAGRGGHASRSLADFAHIRRASVHKPMYIDFRNPYLVRSFAKSALSRPALIVTITECLPGSRDYGGGLPSAAEEYFIEFFTE